MIQFQAARFLGAGSTGVHDYTDLFCFEPKALIFRLYNATAEGYSGRRFGSYGFADADLNQGVVGYREDNGVNPTGFWAFTYPFLGNCIQIGTSGATLVAMLDGGFSLNWGTTSADGHIIDVYAFGGDTCQATVKKINPTTGAQSLTGYGFEGQLFCWLDARGGTWDTENSGGSSCDIGFGTGSGTDEQFALFNQSNSGASPSQSLHTFADGLVDSWGVTSIVGFTADGVDINTVGNYGGVNVMTMILGDSDGDSFNVTVDTQKTSTGTQAKSGIGFQPGAMIAAGVCSIEETDEPSFSALTFGAYDGAVNVGGWEGSEAGQNPTNTASRPADVLISHSDPQNTTNAEAVWSAWGADGYTLDWPTADGTARKFGVVAMDCVPGNPCPVPSRLSFDGVFII